MNKIMNCPLCNILLTNGLICPTKRNTFLSSSHFIINNTVGEIYAHKKDNSELEMSYGIIYFFDKKTCSIYDKKTVHLMNFIIDDVNDFYKLIKLDYKSFDNKIKLYQTFS